MLGDGDGNCILKKTIFQYYCRVVPQASDVVRPSLSDKYKAVRDNVANQLRNKSSEYFTLQALQSFYLS